MTQKTGTIIGVFIKYPTPGKVKTRLAKETSSEFATALYNAFVQDICWQLSEWNIPFSLIYAPDATEDMIKQWLPYDVPLIKQKGKDLGERLINGFNSLYQDYDNVIIIGSDAPDIPQPIYEEAIQNVSRKLVIGPSKDGGYYVIGMPKQLFSKQFFENISWSTESVFQETITRIREKKTPAHELPLWFDNDTLDDISQLKNRIRKTSLLCKKTMLILEKD